MAFHKYVVTAQKPTATQFAVKGLFTSPHETNLILGYVFLCTLGLDNEKLTVESMPNSKGTRIEVYTLTVDGLKPTIEISTHGTIIALRLYTPQVSATALSVAVVLKARFFFVACCRVEIKHPSSSSPHDTSIAYSHSTHRSRSSLNLLERLGFPASLAAKRVIRT